MILRILQIQILRLEFWFDVLRFLAPESDLNLVEFNFKIRVNICTLCFTIFGFDSGFTFDYLQFSHSDSYSSKSNIYLDSESYSHLRIYRRS